MGIPAFEIWSARVTKSLPLTCLNGSVIGIDASHYLEKFLAPPAKEPLLSALGGFPLGLEANIVKELVDLQRAGLKPHFVFDGLEFGIKDDPFGPSIESARRNATAFETYEQKLATDALNTFRNSGCPTPVALSKFLKKILHEHHIPFTVAPFSALAQLAYYEKHPSQFVDAVYGPPELFFFGIDRLITKFGLIYQTREVPDGFGSKRIPQLMLENSSFEWIDRRLCFEELGKIPSECFTDACLLAGSKFLRSFPPLSSRPPYHKSYSIVDAVSMIISCGGSVNQVFARYSSDPILKEMNYVDRYKRALTTIQHHIVITKDGDIETLDKDHCPFDVHDCIGQRLPEELNMYLSRGMIQPRVLNWLTSGTIYVTAPFDGGDSFEYQNLVKTQLEPLRRQALSLLADSINRYYQRKEIFTKLWFEPEQGAKVNIKDLLPSSKASLSKWNVKAAMIQEQTRKLENMLPGSLSFAICSLADGEFAAKTTATRSQDDQGVLTTKQEVIANAIWRFLQLRGFIDEEHHLTLWGGVLKNALSVAGLNREREEAIYIAVELLRLGLLNPNTMFKGYSGAPLRGTEVDKTHCMLVSRTACLGRLHHQARGYSGPLSRHLLSYHSIISSLHASLRDLLEMSLVTMFLEGHVDRERDDWMDLSLALPLYDEHTCALGVVTMNYLDELSIHDDPKSEATRKEAEIKTQGLVEYCNLPASLNDMFLIWDAVYAGVRTGGGIVKDKAAWDKADVWLSQRR